MKLLLLLSGSFCLDARLLRPLLSPPPPQGLLTRAEPDSTVFLTSGYFNLTRAYMQLVLDAGATYRILTASPEVNGFFGAKGVAGAIPAAYTHIARQFYEQVCRLGQQERVHLHEYQRARWSFHAKGAADFPGC